MALFVKLLRRRQDKSKGIVLFHVLYVAMDSVTHLWKTSLGSRKTFPFWLKCENATISRGLPVTLFVHLNLYHNFGAINGPFGTKMVQLRMC